MWRTVERRDILLWPDGFWCFRSEYTKASLRDEDYRVIPARSPEWERICFQPEPAIANRR